MEAMYFNFSTATNCKTVKLRLQGRYSLFKIIFGGIIIVWLINSLQHVALLYCQYQ